ncbi:MAG: hypothetical protein NT069_33765, partial [Planctomycetota bacterium]|nr:hypothetical protein [Planctomycetota bacterium]
GTATSNTVHPGLTQLGSRERIVVALRALKPTGSTPLFAAIGSAIDSLNEMGPDDSAREKLVVVITDGCNFPAVASQQALDVKPETYGILDAKLKLPKENGRNKPRVHVIGIGGQFAKAVKKVGLTTNQWSSVPLPRKDPDEYFDIDARELDRTIDILDKGFKELCELTTLNADSAIQLYSTKSEADLQKTLNGVVSRFEVEIEWNSAGGVRSDGGVLSRAITFDSANAQRFELKILDSAARSQNRMVEPVKDELRPPESRLYMLRPGADSTPVLESRHAEVDTKVRRWEQVEGFKATLKRNDMTKSDWHAEVQAPSDALADTSQGRIVLNDDLNSPSPRLVLIQQTTAAPIPSVDGLTVLPWTYDRVISEDASKGILLPLPVRPKDSQISAWFSWDESDTPTPPIPIRTGRHEKLPFPAVPGAHYQIKADLSSRENVPGQPNEPPQIVIVESHDPAENNVGVGGQPPREPKVMVWVDSDPPPARVTRTAYGDRMIIHVFDYSPDDAPRNPKLNLLSVEEFKNSPKTLHVEIPVKKNP